ncbi:MAG: MATE family efflux transporter [Oscillospiraceae bacterium]|nr:MATE family efflux transporter [Oscillospiraceae bacterium]
MANVSKTTHIRDFTTGNITKQLVVFSMPLFLSNLLQIVYNMVDMIIVGQALGKVGISAVSVGGDVSHFMIFIVMGFANAGQVLIAKYIGAKRQDKLGSFVGTMTGFLFSCAVVVSVVAIIFQDTILSLMNTPAESWQGAWNYSLVCMIGLVFIYGYNIVSAILRGMGDSKHPFVFISIAAVMNLVLDIVFVIFMDMGAGGAALATVISQGTSFVLCAVFLVRNKSKFSLDMSLVQFVRWDRTMLSELLKLGTPMAIKSASIQVSKLFVNSWINSYGVAVSAFAGIANKIGSVANLVSNAMNTAGSTMVSQNIAAGRFDRVKGIMLSIAAIGLSIATVISLAFVAFPQQIFGIFTTDTAVLEIGAGYLPIAVMLFFGSAMRSIMNALINGSGNYKVNFATAILDGIVLRIGLSVLFGLVLSMEHYGFWIGDALAGFTPFFIGLVFYKTGRWKKAFKG